MNKGQRCPNCFMGDISSGACPNCGYERQAEQPGSMRLPEMCCLNGNYLLGRALGCGGFGITYKAFDIAGQRLCAVKEFVPRGIVVREGDGQSLGITSSACGEDFEHGKKRFMEEAQVLRKLSDVSGVVQILDYFQENNTAYFVMEYLEGANLRQLMQMYGGRLPVSEALPIFKEAGTALDLVHKMTGIFHRDVSPDNIMVTTDGRIKLIDFGSAKNIIGTKSQTLSVILKHGYAPPEQYSSTSRQGSFTDVYAFAATFYYAVSGILVTDAPDRFGGEEYRPLKELAPSVGDKISDAVDRALELNSRQRTQSVAEFLASFDAAGRQTPYLKLAGSGGMAWKLPENKAVKIGRSESFSDIIPTKNAKVSKLHCELFFDGMEKKFYLTDHSTNGVYMEGFRLEKGKTYVLDNGGRFSLGRQICDLEVGWNLE